MVTKSSQETVRRQMGLAYVFDRCRTNQNQPSTYYERYLYSIDQLRRGRTTWRSAFAPNVAKSLAGSEGQTCFRLSRHRPRDRRHDLRGPWARGTGGEGLY